MTAPPGDALDNLSEADNAYLRSCGPSDDELKTSWALPVLAAPQGARAMLVASQLEVLEPLWADPEEWCRQALALALERAHGARHG